ncbi:putative HTH-type transcriptional regulator [Stieleria neptunia]|uniref:Putative HTH-type transcriptional regulator n=1 Tax=Stieleria neptunia TaxID=2527979 RepID=A0A518I3W4_9BACT|nr:metalloregulator ArsR/SmtB family transcription factor [Stieleria neptunia]QDV47764.1 putative HTH-type transcriptional regulator [Stieleria neptunia]
MASKATEKKTSKPVGSVKAFGDAAECLKTLAHPVRLRIVQLLLHGRYNVGELAEDCEIPDNVASEHLRLLQRCGFLSSEREGRRVFYQIAEPHLEQLMACVEGRFLQPPAKRR